MHRIFRSVVLGTFVSTAALLTVPAAGPAAAGTDDRGGSIDWRTCRKDDLQQDLPREARERLQCAEVKLPVDYEKPDGKQLTVFVSRRPSTAPDPIGPLFVNQGGPGAEAAQYAAGLSGYPAFDRFDIIGMDPRGTGRSTKLECAERIKDVPPAAFPGSGADTKRFTRGVERFVASCADDPKIRFFGSNTVARDMDAIRERLGADRITYFGKSYGSDLGTAYVSLFPDRVRAALLDGGTDFTIDPVDFVIAQTAAGKRGLARYLETCRTGTCAWTEGDDPQVAWDRLVAAADEQPVVDRSSGKEVTGATLQEVGKAAGIFPAAAITAGLDALVVDGDPEPLLDETAGPESSEDELVTLVAVTCTDLPVDDFASAAERLRAAVPDASADDAAVYAYCAAWPRPVDPIEPRVGAGRGPIAVVSTVGDVNTPYEAGVGLARSLDAPLITWDSNAHTAYLYSPCVQAVADAMLVDLVPVPAAGVTCPDDSPFTATTPPADLEPLPEPDLTPAD